MTFGTFLAQRNERWAPLLISSRMRTYVPQRQRFPPIASSIFASEADEHTQNDHRRWISNNFAIHFKRIR